MGRDTINVDKTLNGDFKLEKHEQYPVYEKIWRENLLRYPSFSLYYICNWHYPTNLAQHKKYIFFTSSRLFESNKYMEYPHAESYEILLKYVNEDLSKVRHTLYVQGDLIG